MLGNDLLVYRRMEAYRDERLREAQRQRLVRAAGAGRPRRGRAPARLLARLLARLGDLLVALGRRLQTLEPPRPHLP